MNKRFFFTSAGVGLVSSFFGVQCVQRNADISPKSRSLPSLDARELQAYAEACKEALGSPEEPAVIPPIDCQAAAMQEIQISGALEESGHLYAKCRNPSALLGVYRQSEDYDEDLCAQGSRILRKDVGDVTWVIVCRKYREHEKTTLFDDVNMIGAHRKTGKTCFFNSHTVEDIVTEPLDFAGPVSVDVEGTTYFQSPRQIQAKTPCLSCHSAAPFLRSPHLHKADEPKKGTVVRLPASKPDAPFDPVWPDSFVSPGRQSQELRLDLGQTTHAKSCTHCHAIGSDRYCKEFVPLAWDQISYPDQYSQALSKQGKSWPERLWHSHLIPELTELIDPDDFNGTQWHLALKEIADECQKGEEI